MPSTGVICLVATCISAATPAPGSPFTLARLAADPAPLKVSLLPEESLTSEPDAADGGGAYTPWLVAGSSLAIIGVLAAWGWGAWWEEGFSEFHLRDTGFLEEATYAGGADKWGHMYGAYLGMLAVTRLYEVLGMNHEAATWVSFVAATLVANGVEVVDGFTSFGFEYGDVVFNTLGIGLALASELWPIVHEIVGMRLGYIPSEDFLSNEKTFIRWINDYSGMLFYLDIKGKGIMQALGREPGFMRFLIAGPVWGTYRYSPVRDGSTDRRFLGLSVGLSMPEVLRWYYDDDAGVEVFAKFFEYYALPFLSVAALVDLNEGDWFINFGVANRYDIGL